MGERHCHTRVAAESATRRRLLVGMGPEFNEFPDTYRHVSRLGIKSLEQAVGGTRGTVNANDDKIKKPHGIISCEYVTNILEDFAWPRHANIYRSCVL